VGRAIRRSGGHRPYGQGNLDLFPRTKSLARWIKLAQDKVHFQGLPPDLLAGLRRAGTGPAGFNDLVAIRRSAGATGDRAEITSLRLGGVALPETEADGRRSDAIADWRCSTRWSTSRRCVVGVDPPGGGVGIGRSSTQGR